MGTINEPKNGGPAFPLPDDDDRDCLGRFESGYGGMSLRDWFAGRVCAALMTTTSADTGFPNPDYREHQDDQTVAERIASISYRMADAMLKAREVKND